MNECWQSGPVGPQVRPSVGGSGRAALGGRFADRERRYLVESGRAAFQTPSNESRRRERHGCVLLSDVHRDCIRYYLGIADWLGREIEEEYPGSHLVSTCSWEDRSCAFVSEDAVRRCC